MPTPVETSFQAGVAALRDGRSDDAEQNFQAVLAADPRHGPALYNLGVLYFHASRSADAEPLLQKAVEARPAHTDTRSVLAAVLVDLKKLDDALPHAQFIVESRDADAAALNTAGHVFALAGQSDDAEAAYRAALAQNPAYRTSALALITLLLDRRAFDDVVAVSDAVLVRRPTDQDIHLKRAQALWEGGKVAAAREALLNLLDFAPDHISAHHNLSLFADQPDPAPMIARLTALLTEGILNSADATKAWFALGNILASQGNTEDSLACFTAGNRVRASAATKAHAESAAAFERRADAVINTPLPEIKTVGVHDGPTPLIIAGPSRAGKSLLQSWLSAHPDIAAADEVGVLPRLAETDFAGDPDRLKEAAATYRATLRRLGGPGKFVIDTHPTNALYLDLLSQLCPDAKIIQIQRNPLDLAVSIFARNFVTGGHWADTWTGIAARLTSYRRLHGYWTKWTPVVASVKYEALVQDTPAVLSDVLTNLDLPAQTLTLPNEPGEPRAMPWASFANRPGVRTDGVDLWKPYAPWLAKFAGAYGRDALPESALIPAEAVEPTGDVARAVQSLAGGEPLSAQDQITLQNVPAFHAAAADQAEHEQRWHDAVDARWRAVSCRPFTHRIRHHVEALHKTVAASPEHAAVAKIHQEVASRWTAYRETSTLKFGDFGTPYQSCTKALIAGSRDTEARAAVYDLDTLCRGQRVLDLGCNTGFLTLAAAESADLAHGIEKERALVEIGTSVVRHLGITNCTLQTGDAAAFASDTPFDVVIAAAVHGWLPLPLPELGRHLAALTAPGGAVLFESQGQRSTTAVEEGFQDKVAAVAEAGFVVERTGSLCDDQVNKRAFVILRKNT